jgi:hypothetical protein
MIIFRKIRQKRKKGEHLQTGIPPQRLEIPKSGQILIFDCVVVSAQ